ncbi:uncharacterized protein [Bemisia tabaci]|uniref:uncharacterized protein n=1 Tax=Bemisia tabaci TaxID=7038 RepID=UPI003B27CFEA
MVIGGITSGFRKLSTSSFRRISRTDSDDDSQSSICPTALSSAIYKGLSKSFKALENIGGSTSLRFFRGLLRRSSSLKTSSNGLQKARPNLRPRSRSPPKTRGSSPQKRVPSPSKVQGSNSAPPPSPYASPTRTFQYKPPNFGPIDWKSIPKLGLTPENWPENPLLRESPPRGSHNLAPLNRAPRRPVSPNVPSPKRTGLYDMDPRMIAYKRIQEELYALFGKFWWFPIAELFA